MRLRYLTIGGVTRFTSPITIDFDAIGDGIVALAGPNGAGKTTILEAPFAALYGEFPSRPGSLYQVVPEQATIELAVDVGNHEYRCLVAVNSLKQTTEAYLFEDGAPLTTGKVRDYRAAVERIFGSPRLMLAAALQQQHRRGAFLGLSKAERKDLMSEILMLSHYQQLADAARTGLTATTERVAATRSLASHLRAEHDALRNELDTAETADLEQRIANLKVVLDECRARVAERKSDLAAIAAKRAELAEAERRWAEHRSRSTHAKTLLENAQAQLLRSKGAKVAWYLQARAERAELVERATALREAAQKATVQVEELDRIIRHHGDAMASAIAERDRLQQEYTDVQLALLDHDAEQARLTELAARASLLDTVPCDTVLQGRCPLVRDALLAKEAIASTTPSDGEAIKARLAQLRMALDDVSTTIEFHADEQARVTAMSQEHRVLAARLPEAETAARRLAEMPPLPERGVTTAPTNDTEIIAAYEAIADLQAPWDETIARAVADVEAAIEAYSAIIAEPEPPCPQITAEMLGAQEEAARNDIREGEQHVRIIETQLEDLIACRASRERAERQLADITAKLQAADSELQGWTRDLTEWEFLVRAFGRDGIPALEIDAAGPCISQITNRLLSSCFGTRFEVALETQRAKADGTGLREVLDITVTDHEMARVGVVELMSGGEQSIISESISLALAIYAGQRSGRTFQTMWRDETAGQLDPENATRYVTMLKRARILADARQVLFVAQQPAVWGAADAVLWVDGGRVDLR